MKTLYKQLVFLLFLIIWLVYAAAHISTFQTDQDISKNVRLQQIEQEETKDLAIENQSENNRGKISTSNSYMEYLGELTPRQKKIQMMELRFSKASAPKKVEFLLEDEENHLIHSYTLENPEKGKQLTWKTNIRVNKNQTYQIRVKVTPANSPSLKIAHVDYQTFFKEEYSIALGLSIGSILIWCFYLWKKRRYMHAQHDDTTVSVWSLLFLSGTAFFSFWMIEYVFKNDIYTNIDIQYIINNWFLYTLVYLILLLICNSVKWTASIGTIFFLLWGFANQYVYLFKGQALQPIDLKSLTTAAHVAKEYDYSLTLEMIVVISATLFLLSLWFIKKEQKILRTRNIKKRLGLLGSGCFSIVLLYGLLFHTTYIDNLQMSLDMWDTRLACEKYGTALSFLGYWKAMEVEKPEHYSVQQITKLEEDYPGTTAPIQTPNIITVMNEAFADLSYLGDFETNIPYMTNYDSLKENTIKGHALVSIFGGGTPNSEFEFLTGHTLGFLPGAIPFAQHIQENHFSMASNLKSQGYQTFAIHLMQKENWRRNAVYPYLGFDQFLSIDDVDSKHLDRVRRYASDKASYEEILKLLDKKKAGEPAFIFNVTVQNHSGYVYTGEDFQEEVSAEGFQSSEVNQYLTLLKKSDEALGMLLENLKSYHEPTILVFFGDHFPRLPEEFYTWLNKGESLDSSMELIQKRFSVPFFIWANYEIDEQENVITSLNYLGAKVLELAGVQLSDYDRYRLDLSEKIPAINANGYITQGGDYYQIQDETEWTKLLNQYWTIEYNEMFDDKHKVSDFFQVPQS